jgi:hypothetical protein
LSPTCAGGKGEYFIINKTVLKICLTMLITTN